jgi:aspartate/methionine/tyrosine aminotransferase
LTEQLAEKLGCKYKEVGLFVWAKLPEGSVSAEKFIDQIFTRVYFYSTGNYLWITEGYIRFALCVKRRKSTGSN